MINFSIIVSRAERYAEEESDFSDEDEDGSSTSRSTSPTGEKSDTEMMTTNESEVSEKQQSNESQSPTPTKSYRKIYAGKQFYILVGLKFFFCIRDPYLCPYNFTVLSTYYCLLLRIQIVAK